MYDRSYDFCDVVLTIDRQKLNRRSYIHIRENKGIIAVENIYYSRKYLYRKEN